MFCRHASFNKESGRLAIQLNLMALSLHALIPLLNMTLVNVGLGMLVIGVALCGIRGLTLLSSWSLPILAATMAYAFATVPEGMAVLREPLLSLDGISIVVATAITAVIDMPTYWRHAKTRLHGLIAVVLLFIVALPLIEGLGVYLSAKNPGGNILETLQHADAPLWNLWVSLFLLLAGWTTNNTNLYSAATALRTVCSAISEKKAIFFIGIIGTLLSLLHVLTFFTSILQVIGIMVGSMGSVILVSYLLRKLTAACKVHKINLAMWGVGVVVGFAGAFKWIHILGIPLLDACLAAGLATLLGHIVLYKNQKEASYEIIRS